MKIAFTYNLRLSDAEEEAEFDTPETVEAIARALSLAGHEVQKIEVSGPASHLVARLEAFSPDLIFNLGEGKRGRAREAFYPALFEELGYPYTGSDAHTLTITLDKWLTKRVLASHGIDTPRGRLFTQRDLSDISKLDGFLGGSLGVPIPAIVKPNFEGSSKGISDESVARDWKTLRAVVSKLLEQYPQGVLVEEYIAGLDVTVPMVEGVADPASEGVLSPVELWVDPPARSKYNLLDYRLKSRSPDKIKSRCPAELPRDVIARLRDLAKQVVRLLSIRDVASIDFRLAEDGRIYFLEVNALPALHPTASVFVATRRQGLTFDATIHAILSSAAVRWKLLPSASSKPKQSKPTDRLRIGFAYNVKRPGTKALGDAEAEYDSPTTIAAITTALESLGHDVVPLEANGDLPTRLKEAQVDLVFNIAEGVSGRNREAQVPALCELCGIPYTGSDAATLSLALDKALTKRLLKQRNIMTPEFQVFHTGREKVLPSLRFPLIVKPIAEGSSKGIAGKKSVVDDVPALRKVVGELIQKYRQPALVEEYITGREFTVGLLGDRRPRILPPMEIVFSDPTDRRPVYDYTYKQDWSARVSYQCPAKLTPKELKAVEKAALDTFQALDCRDVCRIDMRMDALGNVYVLELNPLPGLTPDWSDLVMIGKSINMDYRTLIAEIMAGGLKRLREKRRGAVLARNGKPSEGKVDVPAQTPAAAAGATGEGEPAVVEHVAPVDGVPAVRGRAKSKPKSTSTSKSANRRRPAVAI
jgi:D-alanine-D-alanine ligase